MAENNNVARELQPDTKIDLSKRGNLYLQRVYPNLSEIRKCVIEGVTDASIAEQLGVSYRAYQEYKKYPEIVDIYTFANQKLVSDVKNALYKSATGFTAKEKTIEKKDGEITKVVETEKTFAPNTTAAIFFLTNRDPDNWKHRNALTSLNLTQNNQYNLEQTKGKIEELIQELSTIQATKNGNSEEEGPMSQDESGGICLESADMSEL